MTEITETSRSARVRALWDGWSPAQKALVVGGAALAVAATGGALGLLLASSESLLFVAGGVTFAKGSAAVELAKRLG